MYKDDIWFMYHVFVATKGNKTHCMIWNKNSIGDCKSACSDDMTQYKFHHVFWLRNNIEKVKWRWFCNIRIIHVIKLWKSIHTVDICKKQRWNTFGILIQKSNMSFCADNKSRRVDNSAFLFETWWCQSRHMVLF